MGQENSSWIASDRSRVRVLTANRPEALNALSHDVVQGLTAGLEAAAADENIRVLVLTGSGKAFSAGADLDALADPSDPDNRKMIAESVPAMFEALINFPKPLLMAVNGMGVGFGATVLGLADIAVMAEGARLMVPFSKLSVVPEACSTYTFPKLLGYQRAFWFLLSGEWMSARECLDAGLVLEVLPDEDVLEAVLDMAAHLAQFPAHTLVESKALLRGHNREQLLAANRLEIERLRTLLEHPACAEGIAAVREKRSPNYGGF